jgi:CheY-like chemotaxis protein
MPPERRQQLLREMTMGDFTESIGSKRRAMRESFELGRAGLVRRSEASARDPVEGVEEFAVRRRPVILLAEDDAAMRSLLSSQLRRDGYRVIACQDGMELVYRIGVYRTRHLPIGVDLVISDVRMPLISGLELLELVNEATSGIPVILISAFGDVETRGEASTRSAAAFFSKPFDVDQLRAAVRANLNDVA